MKTLFVMILVILLAAAAGWITFSNSKDEATITIETQEVKEDTHEAIDAGKRLLEKTKDHLTESERERMPKEEGDPPPDFQKGENAR